jgi:sporulation protein YlmC with PRC-barrel domain
MRPLSDIDQSLVGDVIDLRGWNVMGSDGTLLGTVAELIIDLEKGSPVYLNVVPDGNVGPTNECWIRVPYERADLDDDAHKVVLSDAATLGLGTTTV